MGTASFILVGTRESEKRALQLLLSRRGPAHEPHAGEVALAGEGADPRAVGARNPDQVPQAKGAAEEAPGAYKDVEEVAEVAEATGLSRRVARVRPIACVKG